MRIAALREGIVSRCTRGQAVQRISLPEGTVPYRALWWQQLPSLLRPRLAVRCERLRLRASVYDERECWFVPPSLSPLQGAGRAAVGGGVAPLAALGGAPAGGKRALEHGGAAHGGGGVPH